MDTQDRRALILNVTSKVLTKNESFLRYDKDLSVHYAPNAEVLATYAASLSSLVVALVSLYSHVRIERKANEFLADAIDALRATRPGGQRDNLSRATGVLAHELVALGLPTPKAKRAAEEITVQVSAALDETTEAPAEVAIHQSAALRIELFERLCGLVPSQFDEVVFRLQLQPAQLAPSVVPLASRAIELIYLLDQSHDGLGLLERAIAGTLGDVPR